MKITVIGAGAVGGVLSARLGQIGADITCVARGAHGRAIRDSGLLLIDASGEHRVELPCVETVEEAAGDLYLLAVKSQDTAGVLPHLPAGARVVCAQNGVTNEDAVAAAGAIAYGMMVWMPALHLEPGVVEVYSEPPGFLRIGLWPTGADNAAGELAALLVRAGFAAAATDDIARWKWGKLLGNLGNALDAYFTPTAAKANYRAVITEGRAVLDAAGIDYMDPRELSDAAMAATAFRRDPARPRPGGSTWQSVTRRRPTEIAHLNGTIAGLAQAHGVAAPLNAALVDIAADPPDRARTLPGDRLPPFKPTES